MLKRTDLLLFSSRDSYEFSINTEAVSKNLLSIKLFYVLKLKAQMSLAALIRYRIYSWFFFKNKFINIIMNSFDLADVFSIYFFFFEYFYFLKLLNVFMYYRNSKEFLFVYNKANVAFDNSLNYIFFNFLFGYFNFNYLGKLKSKSKGVRLEKERLIVLDSTEEYSKYLAIFMRLKKVYGSYRSPYFKFRKLKGKKKVKRFYKKNILPEINKFEFGYIQSKLFLGMSFRYRQKPARAVVSWLLFFKLFKSSIFMVDDVDTNKIYLVNLPKSNIISDKIKRVAYYHTSTFKRKQKKFKFLKNLKGLFFLSRLAIVTLKVVYSNVFFISEGFKVNFRTNEVTRRVLGNYSMKHGTDRWDIDDLYFGFKSKRVRRRNYWYILRKMFYKLGMSLVYSRCNFIIARFITGFRRNYLINQLQQSIRLWNKKRFMYEKRPSKFKLLMVLFVPKIPFNKGLRKQKAKRKKFRFRKRKNFVLRIRRGFRR